MSSQPVHSAGVSTAPGAAAPCAGMQIHWPGDRSLPRRDMEAFIHQVFARAYGADLRTFMPQLVGLADGEHRLQAALGLRPAASGRLFLETYLDSPVENAIAAVAGRPTCRSQIMEVGNLASVRGGSTRCLMLALTSYLSGAGARWAVFTAVPSIRNAFSRRGLTLLPLTVAEKRRLGAAAAAWGTYYDHDPQVVAVSVDHSRRLLDGWLAGDTVSPQQRALLEAAHLAGQRQGEPAGVSRGQDMVP